MCLGRVGVVSCDYDFVLLIPHQHITLLDVKQGSRLDRDDILISIGLEQQQLALLALLVKNDNVLHIKGVGFAKAKAAITMQQELDLNGGSIGELLKNFRSSRPHRMAVTNSILACLGNFGWSVVQAMQLDDSDDESYISVMDWDVLQHEPESNEHEADDSSLGLYLDDKKETGEFRRPQLRRAVLGRTGGILNFENTI
jgi:hypothetical protein